MEVLMIHHISEEIFKLPLKDYILTFDDGLYSQYYYFDRLSKIDTEKIFFISTNIICENTQSLDFPTCHEAHEKAFKGNKEDYMTWKQIKELMNDPQVTIGGHGHEHKKLKDFNKIIDKMSYIIEDTKKMLLEFDKNLGFKPHKFCYPYNDDQNGMYTSLLKTFGISDFYGQERIPVETLLRN